MVYRLTLAAKAGVFAASLATAAFASPWADLGDIPATVAVGETTIAYRLAGDFEENGRSVDAPKEMRALAAFHIMKYQLTTAEYGACVAERVCAAAPKSEGRDPRLPAVMVSYQDARAYAAWLSAKTGQLWRLPSDEEWRAAAGTRARDDALGLAKDADPSDRWLAKYDAESAATQADERLKPIGAFGANERGVYDLSGNVWEWTNSCFVRYAIGPSGVKPVTENCGVRVVEGEHRAYITDFVRDARAGGCSVGKPPSHLGVRLVREDFWLSRLAERLKHAVLGDVS
jgi:formylglycine-generating enzyme required for sulfatase activity